MKDLKVVTISGSMRYSKEMKNIALQLVLEKEYVVIQCIYNIDNIEYSEKNLETLEKVHYKKIDLADILYVVNIDGYIGESTAKEIEYAKRKGKEIIYHEKGK